MVSLTKIYKKRILLSSSWMLYFLTLLSSISLSKIVGNLVMLISVLTKFKA